MTVAILPSFHFSSLCQNSHLSFPSFNGMCSLPQYELIDTESLRASHTSYKSGIVTCFRIFARTALKTFSVRWHNFCLKATWYIFLFTLWRATFITILFRLVMKFVTVQSTESKTRHFLLLCTGWPHQAYLWWYCSLILKQILYFVKAQLLSVSVCVPCKLALIAAVVVIPILVLLRVIVFCW